MSKFLLSFAALGGALALLAGCGPGAGSYCQTGPKYGTQCYSQMDLQPPGTPPPPAGDPSKR
jgi:hypothetical protein